MQVFDPPRAKRYNVKLKAVVTYESSRRVAEGRSISKNGMALILRDELPIGATVQLTLPVLGEPLQFEGVIRNRHESTYGVAFVHAAEEKRAMLANYCSAMALAASAL